MKKEKLFVLVSILFISSVLAPEFIYRVHAASGEVCLADPSVALSLSPCPASPPVFSGPVGQLIRVGIFVSASAAFSAFDITLRADSTKLKPQSVDLTGTVLLSNGPVLPSLILLCAGGALIAGTVCSINDTADTLHIAAASAPGAPLTASPTTGLLFTAIYNVTSITTSGGISIDFSSNCGTLTSVVGGTCVTLANGTKSSVPETSQGATFNNFASASMAAVSFSANPTNFGPEFPNTLNRATIVATARNGYPGTATDQVSFSATSSSGLTVSIPVSTCATNGTSCSVNITLTGTAAGTYSATVTATFSTVDSLGNPDTLSSILTFKVVVTDYSVTANPTTITFNSGTTGATTITVTSLNGFVGTVNLNARVGSPIGLTVSLSRTSIALTGGTGTSTATFSYSLPTAFQNGHVGIYANSSSVSHRVLVTVNINTGADFSISASPTVVSVKPGIQGLSTITITPVGSFNASIALSFSPPPNLSCTIGTVSMPAAGGSTPLTCSGSMGTYSVVVMGSGVSITHSVTVTFIVSTGVAGLVCIAQSGTSDCPLSPPILTGPAPPTTQQLRVAIVISHSQGLNAFDITLLTNHTLLKPAGADLTGSILTNPSVLAECFGGHGTGCASGDTADTLHIALAIQGLLISPATGLLFTAIYNITGPTQGTTIGYQTGCLSSVAGTTYCVDVADGSVTPVPETVQTASFSDVPSFSITGIPTTLSVQLSSATVSSINVTSINGFSGTVGLTATVSPSGPSASLALTSLTIHSGNANITLLTVTASATVSPGAYSVKVTGTSGALTSSVILRVIVVGRDFSIAASPSIITLNAGTSTNSTISLQSLSGFSGTIQLSDTVSPMPVSPAAFSISLSPPSIVLNTGGTQISELVVSPNTAVSGTYTITVTGTNGTVTHSVMVTVDVADFSIQVSPDSMTVQPNIAGLTVIQVNSRNAFTGIVSLSTTAPSGFNATTIPPILTLPPNSNVFSTLKVLVSTNVTSGDYTVTVVGSSKGIQRSMVVFVHVIAAVQSDFTFSASPSVMTIGQGTFGSTTMIATSVGTFSGTISISLISITPSQLHGLGYLQWINTIVLIPGGSGHASFAAHADSNTITGNYTVMMMGTSGALSHSLTIIVKVTPNPAFAINSLINGPVVVAQGFSNSSVVQITANSLFSGTVSLSATPNPLGLSVTLSTSSVTLAPNQGINVTLTYTAGPSATASFYSVNVTGTSGTMTQFTFITVHVEIPPSPDFTLTVSPTFGTVNAGNSFNYTVTITSLNGFIGTVLLTASSSPSVVNPPAITFLPASLILTSGGTATASMVVTTSTATPGFYYTLTANANGGSVSHFASVTLQVVAPPDEPPVARFTFSPANPIVGETISFDGSSSSDPDGSIQQWTWNFGDNFIDFGPIVFHTYSNPGTYMVTVSVRDVAGLFASANMTIVVSPKPPHDVSINNVYASPPTAVATQQVFISVDLENNGLNNETVSVTAYANHHAVQTLNGIFIQGCPNNFGYCYPYRYVTLIWDTTGALPGNYTVSATVFLPPREIDPSPNDNSAIAGTVTVLPAPVITLSPSSGVDGTKVQVVGTGFPIPNNPYGPSVDYIDVSFDDNSIAFTLTRTGSFNLTIDVPLAQPGPHLVKAFDEYTLARGQATFTVFPTLTGTLSASIDSGTLYFPGDTAVVYVLTSFNGAPTGPSGVQVHLVLFKPDGTNSTLVVTPIGVGLYKATYTISSTGPLGTYAIQASAHLTTGPVNASALRSFEVKPTWLSSNGKTLVSGATVAGVVGLAALAWRQGYLPKRKKDEASASPF